MPFRLHFIYTQRRVCMCNRAQIPSIYWNRNVIILTKFSSLCRHFEQQNFTKIRPFPFQYHCHFAHLKTELIEANPLSNPEERSVDEAQHAQETDVVHHNCSYRLPRYRGAIRAGLNEVGLVPVNAAIFISVKNMNVYVSVDFVGLVCI